MLGLKLIHVSKKLYQDSQPAHTCVPTEPGIQDIYIQVNLSVHQRTNQKLSYLTHLYKHIITI